MKTAMVIDDQDSIRQLVAIMLENMGWNSTGAADCREALRKMEMDCPDLIITDVIMPDMDGMEMLRKIRRVYPGVPTIVMSGDPFGSRFLKSAEVFGAGATIVKPFTMFELQTAVQMAVG